jgi:hypothetical protein
MMKLMKSRFHQHFSAQTPTDTMINPENSPDRASGPGPQTLGFFFALGESASLSSSAGRAKLLFFYLEICCFPTTFSNAFW